MPDSCMVQNTHKKQSAVLDYTKLSSFGPEKLGITKKMGKTLMTDLVSFLKSYYLARL